MDDGIPADVRFSWQSKAGGIAYEYTDESGAVADIVKRPDGTVTVSSTNYTVTYTPAVLRFIAGLTREEA